MAAEMVGMMKSSLSFLLLLILLVPMLALTMSPASLSSSCTTGSGEKGDNAIGHYSWDFLGEDLLNAKLNAKLKKSHRPNQRFLSEVSIGSRLRLTTPSGMRAELIRYHHLSSQTKSSQIAVDIKRSLARAKSMKTASKGPMKGAEGSEHRPLGIQTDLTSAAPFEYLMKISIGSPAQHLVAVADTGSDLVWLQCTPPGAEQGNRNFFEPNHSRTFNRLPCNSKPCHVLAMQYTDWVSCSSACGYSYFYADNSSTTGDLAVDVFHMKTSSLSSIGGLLTASVHNIAFGCSKKQYSTSMLYMNANGIIGLGKGPLSFPSQLGAQYGKKFSYCLVDREKSKVKASPMLFGSTAVPAIPGVQYTPFLDNPVYPTYYYIALERIDVGEEALDVPSSAFEFTSDGTGAGDGGTVIDSGTTFTQLVAPAYNALIEALSTRITYKRVPGYFDFCHDVTGVSKAVIVVPRISFHFRGGAKFDLPFKNAFIFVPDDPVIGKITMCLAMNNSTDLGFTIIGNYQQSNYHILYDLQEKRLGFVPRQCG